MTNEEMERLARYATDKYFDSKDQNTKDFLAADKEAFISDYINTFNLALEEVHKSQNNKFQEFVHEDNSKLFK